MTGWGRHAHCPPCGGEQEAGESRVPVAVRASAGGDVGVGTPLGTLEKHALAHWKSSGDGGLWGAPEVSLAPLRPWQALGVCMEATPSRGCLAAASMGSTGVCLSIFGVPLGPSPPLPPVSPGTSWRLFACW